MEYIECVSNQFCLIWAIVQISSRIYYSIRWSNK